MHSLLYLKSKSLYIFFFFFPFPAFFSLTASYNKKILYFKSVSLEVRVSNKSRKFRKSSVWRYCVQRILPSTWKKSNHWTFDNITIIVSFSFSCAEKGTWKNDLSLLQRSCAALEKTIQRNHSRSHCNIQHEIFNPKNFLKKGALGRAAKFRPIQRKISYAVNRKYNAQVNIHHSGRNLAPITIFLLHVSGRRALLAAWIDFDWSDKLFDPRPSRSESPRVSDCLEAWIEGTHGVMAYGRKFYVS